MSRIGKQVIKLTPEVKIKVGPGRIEVEGPRGKLGVPLPEQIEAEISDGLAVVRRKSESKQVRALHGLTRSLLANAVQGVTQGFTRELDLVGIGFRAQMTGNRLNLSLGFSHPIEFPAPEGIEIRVDRAKKAIANYVATIRISGNDKQQVGQVAADLRALRPPDAYKGKGLRYVDEVVRLKVGKKGA